MKEITKILSDEIQASTDTYKINKTLKLNTVTGGEPTDNVLVHSVHNEVKSVPRSEFGGGVVDLDYSATPTGGTVFSSSGNDALVPLATTVNAGLLSPEEKAKLEGFTITPDATTTVKGKLKLAGDLGGTADLPTTPTALHKTGNETKTGVLSFTNTGVDQTNGIKLTNNGTSYGGVLKVDNNASAYGIWITNTSTGLGALSMNNSNGTGIRSDNLSTGIGIYSYNLRDGIGFSSDNFSSGVGVKLNSNNDSTGDLLNLMKNGTLTGKIDHLGKITSPSFIKSGGTPNQFLKADGSVDSNIYAPLVSPSFTGIPTAPTAVSGTNTTQIATTAFVQANSPLGGNFLPTLTSPLNISASVVLSGGGTYTKVGNIVNGQFTMQVTVIKAATLTAINFSLPVDKINGEFPYGGGVTTINGESYSNGYIQLVSQESKATVIINPATTGIFTIIVQFQYKIK
ncbi:hypothetical protein [Flavobacterium sp. AJR]|uniref:hypothetical protein n=1 Tax=Flavobacterium sp. AJR TaxID=1979369 RepID=UPI000A3D6FA4|nr:hypothetical protein [Flavobacterium sp. AJR]OUL63089.1 hypothetical protein B8T70_06765 [Flavobacterium sp. AJR]